MTLGCCIERSVQLLSKTAGVNPPQRFGAKAGT